MSLDNQTRDLLLQFHGKSYSEMVHDFMVVMDQLPPQGETPLHLIQLGKKLVDEEVLREFYPALEKFMVSQSNENATELLDAICDSVYVLLWTALVCKLPIHVGFLEVQRSNMAKVGPDGKVIKNEHGKVQKPAGWTPPDLFKLVMAHRDVASWNGGMRSHDHD